MFAHLPALLPFPVKAIPIRYKNCIEMFRYYAPPAWTHSGRRRNWAPLTRHRGMILKSKRYNNRPKAGQNGFIIQHVDCSLLLGCKFCWIVHPAAGGKAIGSNPSTSSPDSTGISFWCNVFLKKIIPPNNCTATTRIEHPAISGKAIGSNPTRSPPHHTGILRKYQPFPEKKLPLPSILTSKQRSGSSAG